MGLSTTLPNSWPLLLAASMFLVLGYLIASRRYFHPLAHVPGPFLWTVSGLPILYHQHFREGNLIHELIKLHSIYGPVVRISPTEVHLNDVDNYDKIYHIGSKFLKNPDHYSPLVKAIKAPTILTVVDSEAHRAQRAMLSPYFSRRSVLELEHLIWAKVSKMCAMLQSTLDKGPAELFDLHRAVRALTVDIITEYAYAECWNQLDKPDYGASYQDAIRAIQTVFIWFQTFPVIVPIFDILPSWFRSRLFDSLKRWDDSLANVRASIMAVHKEVEMEAKPERRTIFHELMDPPSGVGDKHRRKLSEEMAFYEAIVLTGAGTETTGSTTERAIFEVLSNPVIYRDLVAELREAFPDPDTMSLTQLEKLPLLNAIVKEGTRLNPGVPGHLPRIVPPGGAVFNGVSIPQGMVVSMSSWVVHHNHEIFPEPSVFNPYRWLGPEDEVRAQDRGLVPFSRGTRNCLGQNLALCEIYCAIAAVFRRFDNLVIGPGFKREYYNMVELFIGYYPKNAPRLHVMKGVSA